MRNKLPYTWHASALQLSAPLFVAGFAASSAQIIYFNVVAH